MAFENMKKRAHDINATALALAAALDVEARSPEGGVRAAATKRVEALRWNLRNEIDQLLALTKGRGGNDAPGSYPALRARFAELQNRPRITDVNLIALSDEVMETVLACFWDAQGILEAAVQDSLARRF